jgi:hypothetical protein
MILREAPSRGDIDAIADLLGQLSTRAVQHDERAEIAVSTALVARGVMRGAENGDFVFVPRHLMDPAVVHLLVALDGEIPLRYFISRNA